MEVVWKKVPVEGFEYEINNLGEVRSLKTGRMKKIQTNTRGYATVSLWEKKNYKTVTIHRMLGLLFLPNPDNKEQINHINGIRNDNSLSNLEWVTQSENVRHAYDTGLTKHLIGEDMYNARFTEEQVLDILSRAESGERICDIAKIYNCSHQTISGIKNGYNWKHLSKDFNIKKRSSKPIIDQYGNKYKSLSEASDKLGINGGAIHRVLNNKRKHVRGYIFKYTDENE